MTPLALVGIPSPLGPYLVLAAMMIGFEVGLLVVFFPKGRAPKQARAFFVTYLLASSIFFWVTLPPAVLDPNLTTWTWVIQAMMLPMTAPFLYLMSFMFGAGERSIQPGGWFWASILTVALVTNEILMAYAFVLLAVPNGAGTMAALFAASVNSVWFAAAMLASMTALLARLPLGRDERVAFGGLAASVLAGPWIVSAPAAAAAIMTAVMIATFTILLLGLTRGRQLLPRTVRVLPWVAAGFAAMSLGALVSIAFPVPGSEGLPFAVATLAVMVGETALLLRLGTRFGAAEPLPTAAWPGKSPSAALLR